MREQSLIWVKMNLDRIWDFQACARFGLPHVEKASGDYNLLCPTEEILNRNSPL